jgi:hypothetical protein
MYDAVGSAPPWSSGIGTTPGLIYFFLPSFLPRTCESMTLASCGIERKGAGRAVRDFRGREAWAPWQLRKRECKRASVNRMTGRMIDDRRRHGSERAEETLGAELCPRVREHSHLAAHVERDVPNLNTMTRETRRASAGDACTRTLNLVHSWVWERATGRRNILGIRTRQTARLEKKKGRAHVR